MICSCGCEVAVDAIKLISSLTSARSYVMGLSFFVSLCHTDTFSARGLKMVESHWPQYADDLAKRLILE